MLVKEIALIKNEVMLIIIKVISQFGQCTLANSTYAYAAST